MKKALCFALISSLAAGMALAASLKLIQPNGGETLTLGQTYPIAWTADGVAQKIKLVLAKVNGVPVGVIAENVEAGASPFSWTVGQFQGGTASPGSYRIRVKVMSGPLEDLSDGVFTIKTAAAGIQQNIPQLDKSIPHAAMQAVAQSIQVLEPVAGSKWAEEGTFTIRWKTFLKKIPRIELYNYNGTKQVAMINHNVFIGQYRADGLYQYEWKIPKGVYSWPGNYTIRVSADNGKVEGFSPMFHISKSIAEKHYTLEPKVENRAHRHYSYKCSSLDTGGTAFPAGPAPGIMRVGWENSWKQWGVGNYCHRHLCFIYRSFITFDVSAFAKGKFIQKATLYINKESTHYSDGTTATNVNHPGHCASKLFKVEAPWSSPFDVQADLIGDGTAGTFDVTAIVRDWALKGGNHGLMLVGRSESFKKNNEECISYYKAFLTISTLED